MAFPAGSTGTPVHVTIFLAVQPDGSIGLLRAPVLTSQVSIPGVPDAITQTDDITDSNPADLQAIASLVHTAVEGVFAEKGVTLNVPPQPAPVGPSTTTVTTGGPLPGAAPQA